MTILTAEKPSCTHNPKKLWLLPLGVLQSWSRTWAFLHMLKSWCILTYLEWFSKLFFQFYYFIQNTRNLEVCNVCFLSFNLHCELSCLQFTSIYLTVSTPNTEDTDTCPMRMWLWEAGPWPHKSAQTAAAAPWEGEKGRRVELTRGAYPKDTVDRGQRKMKLSKFWLAYEAFVISSFHSGKAERI